MLRSPQTADIFEIFAITEQENAYTSLIAYLLQTSAPLRKHILQVALPELAPFAVDATASRQVRLTPSEVVDILLEGTDDSGQRWACFIEAKVHSAEHGNQTERYFVACQQRVGPTGRVAGVLLTLDGAPADHPPVRSLKHRDLADWVAATETDFAANPVLPLAARAYIERARVPPPVADDQTAVKTLCKHLGGLVPRLAGADVLAKALIHDRALTWHHRTVWIQGRGHGNPGLVFWQSNWVGSPISEGRWRPANHNVHFEIELKTNGPGPLKLHFETEPYHTQNALKKLDGHATFIAVREAFRRLLHAKTGQLPGWKATNHRLQIAAFRPSLGDHPTVADLRTSLAPAFDLVGPFVTNALVSAAR